MSIRLEPNGAISIERHLQDNVHGKIKASGSNPAIDFVYREPHNDCCTLQEMIKEMGSMEEVYRRLERQNSQLIEKLENQRCQQEHIVEDMISKAKFLHEVLDEARLSENRDQIITVKNLYIDQLMNTLEMMLESNMHLKDECTHLQKELKSLEIACQKGPQQVAESNKVQPETPRASPLFFCFPFLHRNKPKAPKDRKALSLKCK
ncbi:protein Daple-like [Heterodontus francisci]|uniref:protein Daple-like n=1 Tax=Heterodontus francisci TaxID=7792 RepID=UPI00355C0B04